MEGKDKIILGVNEFAPNESPFPDPVIETPTHWICDDCKELLPAADFPNLAPKPGKKNLCELCEKSRITEKTVLRRRDRFLKGLADAKLTPGKAPEKGLPSLGDMVGEMMYRFGGVEQFCALWHQHIICALNDKPGGKTGMDQLYALAKMAAEVQKIDNQKRAVDRMDEEDMAREIESYMKKLATERSKIVDQEVIEFDPT